VQGHSITVYASGGAFQLIFSALLRMWLVCAPLDFLDRVGAHHRADGIDDSTGWHSAAREGLQGSAAGVHIETPRETRQMNEVGVLFGLFECSAVARIKEPQSLVTNGDEAKGETTSHGAQ
jgi:hypothetical protein